MLITFLPCIQTAKSACCPGTISKMLVCSPPPHLQLSLAFDGHQLKMPGICSISCQSGQGLPWTDQSIEMEWNSIISILNSDNQKHRQWTSYDSIPNHHVQLQDTKVCSAKPSNKGQIITERTEMELHPNKMRRGWPMCSRSLKSLIHCFRKCRCPSFPYISNKVPHTSSMERHQLDDYDSIYILPFFPSFAPTDCT